MHHLEVADVVRELGTDPRLGLTSVEAAARLAREGRNELPCEVPLPAWRRFVAQFRNVLVILLLVATAVSVVLWLVQRDTTLPYEALAIFAIVLLNALLGFVQERRAEAAVTALRAMAAQEATVVREGERHRIAAAEVVRGDVLLLGEGDTIAADARVVESAALQTSEAALTGESLPVSKQPGTVTAETPLGDRRNTVWNGTIVTYGRGRAIVTATGPRTELGRIVGLLRATPKETTPLQRELDRTGRVLGAVILGLALAMSVTVLAVTEVRTAHVLVDVLLLGVALAVAAVPEGLPTVVTAVLAIGVQRLAHRKAIVRRLAAVETLGSASVIAADKTGTLTRNEMTVRTVVTASGRVEIDGYGYAPIGGVRCPGGGAMDGALRLEVESALAVGDRANNADLVERAGEWVVHGDPTEAALRVAARKAGLSSEMLAARFPRVAEMPFSSERKLMSTVHRDLEREPGRVMFTKGAPDVVLARCSHELLGGDTRSLTRHRRAEILAINEELASAALRTLGVARRQLSDGAQPLERDLVFAGLVGMIDPPRREAAEAVARARGAGIRALMITGDHPRTASVIARELGISADGRTVTGPELARMSEEELAGTVAGVSVYARVDPEHKLRIVHALQRGGAVVAMTGDGVNDAPALRAADIGVAMGLSGTDVSKGAADIVLADDNFVTIVAAVEEGRTIFANIRKFVRFLLSSNIGEVLTMFLGAVLGARLGMSSEDGVLVLPLLAAQLLWINLVTDGLPALALGIDPTDERHMRAPPRPRGQGVLTSDMWRGIVLVAVVMTAGTLFVVDASLPGGFVAGTGSVPYAQTMAFTTLVLYQLFNVFNARSDRHSAFRGLFRNGWLWGAVAISIGLQALVVYVPALGQAFGTVPLGAADWGRCVAVASTVLWARELGKLIQRLRGGTGRSASATLLPSA